jgi:molybdenum-dependent DNA-binding transcriptional regulator ModE
MRGNQGMSSTHRGRPPLGLDLDVIIEAVRRHGYVARAAKELDVSPSYIWSRFKDAGLTLATALEERSHARDRSTKRDTTPSSS